MPLSATLTGEYLRSVQQQQQLYAFWFAVGDLARAHLAMDVANWYYQQLGMSLVTPSNDAGYTPNPTDPVTAGTLAQSLPLDPNGAAIATSGTTRLAASGSGGSTEIINALGGGGGGGGHTLDEYSYCSAFPDDPICSGSSSGGGGGGGGGTYCDLFPEDPSCPQSGAGGGIPPVVVVNVPPTTVTINQTGLTLGDVASRISGAIASAASAIASAADAVVAAALQGVQNALGAIANALAGVFQDLARLAGLILKFLQGLLIGIVHALVAAVQAIGKMLQDVYQNVLQPMLGALQKARAYLMQIYQRFLRPLLIWLQDARRVLAILKAFHIGFATKLDNALAQIQSKISTPLFFLLSYVNGVANYINLILTAGLILQRPLFLNSFNAYLGSAVTLALNGMAQPVDPATLAAAQAAATLPTPAQSQGDLNQYLTDGTGPDSATIAQAALDFDAILTQGLL